MVVIISDVSVELRQSVELQQSTLQLVIVEFAQRLAVALQNALQFAEYITPSRRHSWKRKKPVRPIAISLALSCEFFLSSLLHRRSPLVDCQLCSN